ncbi:MAG TPA: trigger factor [Gammaproteobacteria bacterium]|nr:trigger factor [Gammaproteobacteria bacterium]
MEVSVESTGGLERRMTVQVPADRVEREVDERLRSLSQRAKLKGFRPGKVPMKVVRQRYGDEVRQDVVRELLQSSWNDAISEHKLTPAGGPRIDTVKAEPGAGLEYTAVFEVFPDIKIDVTDGLKVRRPQVEIEPADVDGMLDNLRHQRATWEPVERSAASGDQVTIDFHGSIDGEPFPGGHGHDVPIEIGGGRMIPGFEAGLEGIAAGEERDIEVTFPADYQAENLAGKTATFHVNAHSVAERRVPEIDAEFAKGFGIGDGDIAALRAEVEQNMRRELDEQVRARLKEQLFDRLMEANPLTLPGALVEDEIARLREDTLGRMGIKDTTNAPELPREMFEDRAKKRVALGLLMGELIKREGMKADPDRVQKKLEALTQDYDKPEQVIRAYRANADAMRQVENLVIEDQLADWLLERAEIIDEPSSFAAVMGLERKAADAAPAEVKS